MIIAVNFGYTIKGLCGGILSYFPLFHECESFGEFSKEIRHKDNINALFFWADSNHVPASSICLFLNIDHRDVLVRMINVREYRSKWEKKHKKKWKVSED